MPLAGIFASHMGFRICRALMSYIGGSSPLDYEDCQQCSRRAGFFDVTFSSDAHAGNQGAIHREIRVTATTVSKNLGPRGMNHQPLAVLTEGAMIKGPLIQTHIQNEYWMITTSRFSNHSGGIEAIANHGGAWISSRSDHLDKWWCNAWMA